MSTSRARLVDADETGTFEVEGLAAGDYAVAAIDASTPVDLQNPADVEALARVATRVTLGVLCIGTGQHTLLGWTGIVLAVVNTPALIIGGALLVAVEVVRTRRLRYIGALAAAAALVMSGLALNLLWPLVRARFDARAVAAAS